MSILRNIEKKYNFSIYDRESLSSFTSISEDEYEYVLPTPYDIDFLEPSNCWCHGQIYKVHMDISQENKCPKWTIFIQFPNWPQSVGSVKIFDDADEPPEILEFGTQLIPKHQLFKSTESLTTRRRITCYISSEAQTLRNHHMWYLAEQHSDGSITISNSKGCKSNHFRGTIVWDNSIIPNTTPVWITTPISISRRKDSLTELNEKIYAIVKNKFKTKKSKERKIKMNIKKSPIPIINKYSVKYYKNKPRVVMKSCIAWKKKWVNIYGFATHWTKGQSIASHDLLRYMSTFMPGKDTLRFAMTNRKHLYEIINPTFIKTQHSECASISLRRKNDYLKWKSSAQKYGTTVISLKRSLNNLPYIASMQNVRKAIQEELRIQQSHEQKNKKEVREAALSMAAMNEKMRMYQIFKVG